jgi:hypothetical protein
MTTNKQQQLAINKQRQMEKISSALEKVSDEINQMAWNLAKEIPNSDIIQTFNQETCDLFEILIGTINTLGVSRECNINGHKIIFENALKINIGLPIEQFTFIVLQFAPEIYDEKETFFLEMKIPNQKVQNGNEFSLINSEAFKKLWLLLNHDSKQEIKDKIILMTTYAHAYFYKVIIKSADQK